MSTIDVTKLTPADRDALIDKFKNDSEALAQKILDTIANSQVMTAMIALKLIETDTELQYPGLSDESEIMMRLIALNEIKKKALSEKSDEKNNTASN